MQTGGEVFFESNNEISKERLDPLLAVGFQLCTSQSNPTVNRLRIVMKIRLRVSFNEYGSVNNSVFHDKAFLSDNLTDLKLHRTK